MWSFWRYGREIRTVGSKWRIKGDSVLTRCFTSGEPHSEFKTMTKKVLGAVWTAVWVKIRLVRRSWGFRERGRGFVFEGE